MVADLLVQEKQGRSTGAQGSGGVSYKLLDGTQVRLMDLTNLYTVSNKNWKKVVRLPLINGETEMQAEAVFDGSSATGAGIGEWDLTGLW